MSRPGSLSVEPGGGIEVLNNRFGLFVRVMARYILRDSVYISSAFDGDKKRYKTPERDFQSARLPRFSTRSSPQT